MLRDFEVAILKHHNIVIERTIAQIWFDVGRQIHIQKSDAQQQRGRDHRRQHTDQRTSDIHKFSLDPLCRQSARSRHTV